MGNGKFQSSTASTPLNQSPVVAVDYVGDPYICIKVQIWCKSVHSGLQSKWVKYYKNYFYY